MEPLGQAERRPMDRPVGTNDHGRYRQHRHHGLCWASAKLCVVARRGKWIYPFVLHRCPCAFIRPR